VHAAPGEVATFRKRDEQGARLFVDAEFEDALHELGLPAPARVERLLAAAPAAQGRAATATLELPGRPERLHLRPVVHGGALARLWGRRLWGIARPVTELRVSATLRARGAPVPRPVCVIGWRAAPLWSAVLGTVHLEGGEDGLAWLARSPDPPRIASVAAAAGRAVRRFHDVGGRHADLHVKNLLLRDSQGSPEVFVIDLDKARAEPVPDAGRRMRELARLYRSLHKRQLLERVGHAGRNAFLGAYLAGDAALGRAMLAHWPAERRRVARHALGYGATD
jgi:3-deoxy-D-manno-octulosonic acid kinase